MKGRVELLGMEFHAFHGCLPEERRDGARYLVDFSADYDMSAASRSDCLEDAADYSQVYEIVRREMAVPSNLLENVAGRILEAVAERFPELERVSVSVAKEHPPVGGPAAWARVKMRKD